MSNYTKTTNFAVKDSLASGDTNKVVRGAELNTEYDNISTAVATKYDTTTATAAAATYAPIYPFTDTNPLLKGSGDATKLVRFEVDGLTTAVTRVITVPDKDITLAGLVDLRGIQPFTTTATAGALNFALNPTTLDFRSATLGSGAVITRALTSAVTLQIGINGTLGAVSGVQSRIVILAIDNAGTIELAAVNIAGGNDLSETGVINTSTNATLTNAIYANNIRTNVAYRVVGFVDAVNTSGSWANPVLVQGAGGQALAALSSLGYGQTWQVVTRAAGTTYYNTTGKPITLSLVCILPNTGTLFIDVTQNGATVRVITFVNNNTGSQQFNAYVVIPPGAAYVSAGNTATSSASELR